MMNINETRNTSEIINDTLSTIHTDIQVSGSGELVINVIVYSIIIILSIIGNVIVVTAILRVQRLRHPTNFILMSLAIADLLVTTTVMIPGFISEIKQKWIFGRIFCNIWVANDITFCTASILHLVAVSFDRYVAIENPLKYKQKMTKRTILIIIGCIWLISVLLSYAPVLLGVYSQSRTGGATSNNPDECNMRPNLIYSIISALTSFYIPLIIILFLYGRIYITARKHSRELRKLEIIIQRLHSDNNFLLENKNWNTNLKAIRTLGIVVGVFVACWLPFFVMYLVLACCNYTCAHPLVERYITWIGYVNSFCNPMIYAFSNKEFRNAFFEILNYNNCRCISFSCALRTSISKSIHSMNIKGSSPVQSRQTSVTPYSHSLQRNDQFSCTTSSILSAPSTKKPFILTNTDSTDGYEMQTLSPQQKTLEAFHELEQLVPNGISGRVSIVRMSSLIQDQDDIGIETPPCKKN
ncbi:unnamed protein product [Adineta steineri]|uniref:G-protein coupled receptors family 1 profile domain-containing protein n=2 Tax=Adineta steineri TaxID=433720 RepID=A0A814HRB6_9BILA|nr:unnamed protein product [Adineta steineri]CAF1251178.1 unnamed protein product [Adineta steineri]